MILALLLAAEGAQPAPELVPLVPPPPEYTLELKDAAFRVHVNFKPGEPQPGEVVELRFDVARNEGDPQKGLKLALTVTGPGPRTRYLVRPLGDAGVYGAHWTPAGRGLWTLALGPYKDAGPNVTFQVGAGEPMPVSSQGHMVQASRTVVGARAAEQPTVKALMADLGRRWLRQVDSRHPDPAELAAMAKLLRAMDKKSPEFQRLAGEEADSLDRGVVPDATSCLECHMRFRDSWVRR